MRVALLTAGIVLGLLLHIGRQRMPERNPMAEGTLRFEPPVDPAVTPSFPTGFYVESRVYLEVADSSHVGRGVVAWGTPDVASYLDSPSFPKVMNRSVSEIRGEAQSPVRSGAGR